ncbi:OLC1v1003703C1 [Oldenlandia corymbosa var. corymbosa]|uniref:OLC1v1003703C1 n=1 Tax=Oldenlandia corymbosa var. corymbosa TaxID=529605 RepID=A0AAV1DBF0_OLDCO|nr:OLC1v1003703C1 [Oldenlandia corymbosa var. corymbosa]
MAPQAAGTGTKSSLWCKGSSAAECLAVAGGEYSEMTWMSTDSQQRRVLGTRGTTYISYGALRSNSVPCSRRGASYYNCLPGAEANPYTRGCTAITRCRS